MSDAPSAVTQILAIYGAAVATISVMINVTREWRDRGQLIVKGMIGSKIETRGNQITKGPSFFVLTVTNKGRRPIIVTHVLGKTSEKVDGQRVNFWSVPDGPSLPWTLTEGESTTAQFHLEMLAESVTSIFVADSVGREWRLSKRRLRKLKKEAIAPLQLKAGVEAQRKAVLSS